MIALLNNHFRGRKAARFQLLAHAIGIGFAVERPEYNAIELILPADYPRVAESRF